MEKFEKVGMGDIVGLCNYSVSYLVEMNLAYADALGGLASLVGAVHRRSFALVCLAGILTNLATAVVLLQPTMRTSVNLVLVAIALCDGLTNASSLLYSSVSFCSPTWHRLPWTLYASLYANLSVAAHAGSLWLTVLMAALRFRIIHSAPSNPSATSPPTAKRLSLLTLLLVALCCLPNVVRNQIHALRPEQLPLCVRTSPFFPANASFYGIHPPPWWTCGLEKAHLWIAALSLKLIPCALLPVFMSLLIASLLEAKRRRRRLGLSSSATAAVANTTDRTTRMLILIVLIFLLTEIPQGALVIWMIFDHSALLVYRYFGDLLDLLSLGQLSG